MPNRVNVPKMLRCQKGMVSRWRVCNPLKLFFCRLSRILTVAVSVTAFTLFRPAAAGGAFPFLASGGPRRQLLQRLGAWFIPLGLAVRASRLAPHSSPALLALKKPLPSPSSASLPPDFKKRCQGCAPHRSLKVQLQPMPRPFFGHGKARHGGGL